MFNELSKPQKEKYIIIFKYFCSFFGLRFNLKKTFQQKDSVHNHMSITLFFIFSTFIARQTTELSAREFCWPTFRSTGRLLRRRPGWSASCLHGGSPGLVQTTPKGLTRLVFDGLCKLCPRDRQRQIERERERRILSKLDKQFCIIFSQQEPSIYVYMYIYYVYVYIYNVHTMYVIHTYEHRGGAVDQKQQKISIRSLTVTFCKLEQSYNRPLPL